MRTLSYRAATATDVGAMLDCRVGDPAAGPGDARMAAYFAGHHHPQQALAPRAGYVALDDDRVIGYIAGHLTRRHGCEGEVQYLYVAPAHRRSRVATALLELLAGWFTREGARRVCVNVDVESPAAAPFYRSHGAAPLSRFWYVWEDIELLASAGRDPAPGA